MEDIENKKEEINNIIKEMDKLCTENNKLSNRIPEQSKVHALFKSFLFWWQDQRVQKGKELVKDKISLPHLTKILMNALIANPKMIQMLIEVEITKQ